MDIIKVVGGKTVLDKNSYTGARSLGAGNSIETWTDKSQSNDVFFPPIPIDNYLTPKRANAIFPYKLLVIDARNNMVISSDWSETLTEDIPPEMTVSESNTGGVTYTIGANTGWSFTLPITPQQLSITDQFAINTTATMRGIVEEHNGVKFKIISASGTTGIWPTRANFEDPNPAGLSLFGGTLSAIGGAVSAFDKLAAGGNPKPTKLNPQEDNMGRNTGYFQALLLQQFLEQYAIAKKNPKHSHWRLVFDCPKTNESFVVTPIQYNVTRSQRSPGEFLYNMQFKAWKRVKLRESDSAKIKDKLMIPLESGFFQKAVNTLDNTRSLMSASLNVIQAVRADYRQVFDQVRKVSLLVKDLGGIAFALCDFPNQLIKDVESAVRQMASDINSTELPPIVKDTVDMMKALNNKNEGMSQAQVKAGVLGKDAKDSNEASSTNKTINNPEGNYEFFKLIDANSLKLDMEQKNALQDEAIKNAMISIQELKEIVNNLRSLVYDLSNSFGAGDTFISTIYNKPSPKERATPMTLEEFELIRGLEEVVTIMLILTATRDLDDSRKQNSLEYVGGLANDSSIPFDSTATAKILVPVPYNLTIEQISARYLGDPDRYNEIITLNNLRSPYIDENGFFYNLLSNGDGRQFNINSKENLYVSQKIQLFSNTIPMFTRKIIEIEKITDTNYLITVDGLVDDENDLKKLKVSDNAKIKAYLPGTVNSQNQIYIPSDQTITEESRTYDIPFLKDDTLTSLSKIDWLLDENGDVIIDSFGEISLANGTTNLIQALKMKIVTQKGTLLSNPEFGLGLKPGISVADADIQNILKDLRDMVTQDPRFEGVENIELNILPPEVSITINAKLINGNGIFPINFSV